MEAGALIGLGAIVLIAIFIKKKVASILARTLLKRSIEADHRITEIIAEIRVLTSSDRVSIYMFHNGDHYVNGNSILRISCAYETIGAGVQGVMTTSQNILCSTVPEALDFILTCKGDEVYHAETTDLPFCFYRSVLEANGVIGVAKYPLKYQGEVIGFVCLDFVKDQCKGDDALTPVLEYAPQLELHINNRQPNFLSKFFKAFT
jgi:hypothetical protein